MSIFSEHRLPSSNSGACALKRPHNVPVSKKTLVRNRANEKGLAAAIQVAPRHENVVACHQSNMCNRKYADLRKHREPWAAMGCMQFSSRRERGILSSRLEMSEIDVAHRPSKCANHAVKLAHISLQGDFTSFQTMQLSARFTCCEGEVVLHIKSCSTVMLLGFIYHSLTLEAHHGQCLQTSFTTSK